MEPYILDLREEGCPMALLLAKRAGKTEGNRSLIIQVSDMSSQKDIIRYFDKCGFSVQVEAYNDYSTLTITK